MPAFAYRVVKHFGDTKRQQILSRFGWVIKQTSPMKFRTVEIAKLEIALRCLNIDEVSIVKDFGTKHARMVWP